MSLFTHFSLNALEGMRGNIGKIDIKEYKNKNYFDVMLFLVPNADKEEDEATRRSKATQIVNVRFPEEAVKRLQEFDQGDYVRIGFSRIDLHKGMSKKTGKEELFISAEATSIELLRKAKKKEALELANEIKEEVKKVAQW